MTPAAAGGSTVVVVGGGIIGTMHALLALDQGCNVVHIERELAARGASVRNFGLVWVGGRARGAELQLAVRARELWEEIAGEQIAKHVRAVALEGDLLILEAANPRWRTEMAVHQVALLARLAEALGPSAPSRLSVRVAK